MTAHRHNSLCGPDCRYRTLYEGAQSSLADMAAKQAVALNRLGRVREGLVLTLRATAPRRFAQLEAQLGMRLSEADDETMLACMKFLLEPMRDEAALAELHAALAAEGYLATDADPASLAAAVKAGSVLATAPVAPVTPTSTTTASGAGKSFADALAARSAPVAAPVAPPTPAPAAASPAPGATDPQAALVDLFGAPAPPPAPPDPKPSTKRKKKSRPQRTAATPPTTTNDAPPSASEDPVASPEPLSPDPSSSTSSSSTSSSATPSSLSSTGTDEQSSAVELGAIDGEVLDPSGPLQAADLEEFVFDDVEELPPGTASTTDEFGDFPDFIGPDDFPATLPGDDLDDMFSGDMSSDDMSSGDMSSDDMFDDAISGSGPQGPKAPDASPDLSEDPEPPTAQAPGVDVLAEPPLPPLVPGTFMTTAAGPRDDAPEVATPTPPAVAAADALDAAAGLAPQPKRKPARQAALRPEMFPSGAQRSSSIPARRRRPRVSASAPDMDVPGTTAPEAAPVAEDVDSRLAAAVMIPRPVFISDLVSLVGNADVVESWVEQKRSETDSPFRFIPPKARHKLRGSLVLPIGDARLATTEFTQSWWSEFLQFRGAKLYELAVLMHHVGDQVMSWKIFPDQSAVLLRLSQPRGIVGVLVLLDDHLDVGDSARASLCEAVEELLQDRLDLIVVLTTTDPLLEPAIAVLDAEAAARQWAPTCHVVAARSWEWATGNATAARHVIG